MSPNDGKSTAEIQCIFQNPIPTFRCRNDWTDQAFVFLKGEQVSNGCLSHHWNFNFNVQSAGRITVILLRNALSWFTNLGRHEWIWVVQEDINRVVLSGRILVRHIPRSDCSIRDEGLASMIISRNCASRNWLRVLLGVYQTGFVMTYITTCILNNVWSNLMGSNS